MLAYIWILCPNLSDQTTSKQDRKGSLWITYFKCKKNSFEGFSKSDRSKLKKISRKAQSNKRFRFKLAKNPTSVAKQYGLSSKGFKFLTAKVNAEDLGKGTVVQSGCLCTHCCVTTINSKPGQDRVQYLNKKANYLKASPTFKQIRWDLICVEGSILAYM